jgi:hypothetical protein
MSIVFSLSINHILYQILIIMNIHTRKDNFTKQKLEKRLNRKDLLIYYRTVTDMVR